ncbi:thiolase family protein [Shewanella corallii]|uniref:Thiolase family protein n=1 Tax=Shewanella corallii TaxID=560080 RepID=A0ABT0NBN1_9GAMM|nr:thiolase family protein [Shewanella corallii]MCL2915505.1 thiolase family protein [Shewanella corallii]
MAERTYIVGIGIHKFGRTPGVSGIQQASIATAAAMEDARIQWEQVEFAFGGSQDAGNADTLLKFKGLSGIPFINVANGCATGGSALISAVNALKSGMGDIGLVTGFDKHEHGAFRVRLSDWGLPDWYGEMGFALTTQFFAMKINRYMHDYGISENALVAVAQKAFYNGSLNPMAWRQQAFSADEIIASPMLNYPLRKYMFCSPSEGAISLIVCNDAGLRKIGSRRAIQIRGCALNSRREGTFEVFTTCNQVANTAPVTTDASRACYEAAGIGPEEVNIAQLQDTESGAEIMHMAETGLCEHGDQEQLILTGKTSLTGSLPINTDGGCLANGEPVGASGLRQIYENVLQLRGEAGKRQVATPKMALSQVYGAPGISCVSLLSV